MLTVRAPAEVADRLRQLDSGRLLRWRTGPAAFVVGGEDADVDVPVDVETLWRDRLRPFAEALAAAGPMRAPAALRPYDPEWPRLAARRLRRLRVALAPIDDGFDYQHIGSTSVPGLTAKPFVDLQVRVPALSDPSTLDGLLRDAGYHPATGARPDSPGVHRDLPRGGEDVPDEVWAKRLFVSPDPGAPAILHVRRADSPWGRYTVAFRDLLRADPAEAARYARTKTELARRHAGDPDYDDYTRAKTAFFDAIQDRLNRG
jgi:dephospho-CoA kinase